MQTVAQSATYSEANFCWHYRYQFSTDITVNSSSLNAQFQFEYYANIAAMVS